MRPQGFEGDMAKLTDYSAALATTLEVVREAAGGRPIELLRKESLAGMCMRMCIGKMCGGVSVWESGCVCMCVLVFWLLDSSRSFGACSL